ncbi:uncharacterized protein N7484_001243 [Penicillium longicatenatum]|uniref:uncharacterized protein n=1 Tax=Penicillium longicatenatum TaxID=1561947 RepID=UPI0025485D4A|nr:uncharacterized protein N7484_001243 [Penicillium longicatenatum]KAJ5657594.1 hypothetical protein N7484_001243 [Penicillium longicatenatum]
MIHPKTLAEHPCSRLESLPVEIIELIFLHSLEINLPRASLHLGRALSNPTLYTWLIRLVFSSTNSGSQSGFFTPDFLPPPLDFWGLSWEQRQHLSTILLGCRWCTLPLMRKCQREYVDHVIRRKCADLLFSPEDQETMRDLGPRFEDLELHDRPRMGESRGKGDLVIHAQLPEDKTTRATTKKQRASSSRNHVDRKVAIWFHYGAVQIREPNEIYYENDLFRLPSSTAIGPGRIPDKLLRLPWSDSQFDFLHLLSSDFYVDEDEYSNIRSTEITSRLIRRRNSEPFRQLLQMSFRSAHCRIPSRWPLQRLHYYLVRRCAVGKGDPFASAILYERWNDLTTTVDEDLMKFFEKQAEDLS